VKGKRKKGERITIVWDIESDTWSASWHNKVGSCPLGTFATMDEAMKAAQAAMAAVDKLLEEKSAVPPLD
jgi:hypothetical protein